MRGENTEGSVKVVKLSAQGEFKILRVQGELKILRVQGESNILTVQ